MRFDQSQLKLLNFILDGLNPHCKWPTTVCEPIETF